jgi:hypothetical protein
MQLISPAPEVVRGEMGAFVAESTPCLFLAGLLQLMALQHLQLQLPKGNDIAALLVLPRFGPGDFAFGSLRSKEWR